MGNVNAIMKTNMYKILIDEYPDSHEEILKMYLCFGGSPILNNMTRNELFSFAESYMKKSSRKKKGNDVLHSIDDIITSDYTLSVSTINPLLTVVEIDDGIDSCDDLFSSELKRRSLSNQCSESLDETPCK